MEQQVMYKFSRIELEQFAMFEENIISDIKEAQFQTEAQFTFDKKYSVLCSRIVVNMSVQNQLLLKAELKSFFDILPESVEELKQNGKIIFPPLLLVQFASLCYSSMRGVIFAKTIGTSLNKYVLPPLYFDSLIDKSFVVEE